MKQFEIVFSKQANTDIQNLSNTILYQYHAPLTAFKYVQGLLDEIKKLKQMPIRFLRNRKIYFNMVIM